MNVYLVSRHLSPIEGDALVELKEKMGAPLPQGYEQFVRQFGVGNYCDIVNLHHPNELLGTEPLDILREYLNEFWPNNEFGITAEKLETAYHFGNTDDGDTLVYFPREHGETLVFPRNDDRVLRLASGFEDPINWVTAAGTPAHSAPIEWRYFTPARPRCIVELFTAESHQIDEVYRDLVKHIGKPNHTLFGENYRIHFVQRIGGRVELTHSPDDPRVGLYVEHDISAELEVEPFIRTLISRGFYKTEEQRNEK